MSYTPLSGAIDFGTRQLGQSGLQPVRQIIDISGDGANNQGRTVTLARDEALARGITINGLPITLKRLDSAWDIDNLDLYFRDCVIGGPGAFLFRCGRRHSLLRRSGPRSSEKSLISPRLTPSFSLPRPHPRQTVWLEKGALTSRQGGNRMRASHPSPLTSFLPPSRTFGEALAGNAVDHCEQEKSAH
jgi:hypothetical protein